MELSTRDGFIKTSEDFEKSAFKINASSKAFAILSSALYQNKVRAIIRELSCNAIDSQVEAKSDKIFEMNLPTWDKPNFRIRDFGTGISPENIINVYTTYFESTKTKSNEQIGCLGLGSKTPFCYTDNFMVNSYYEGKKRSYACVISANGMPAINFISEEDSAEHSGLEIFFAVKSSDFKRFEDEAAFVVSFLKMKPKGISGLHINTPMQKGKSWKLFGKDYYQNSELQNSFVIMGGVPYKINSGNIPGLTKEEIAVVDANLWIEVPIGAVEPQASRESLSFTKETISFLKKEIKEIVSEIKKEHQVEIDKLASYFDALMYLHSNTSRLQSEPYRTLFQSFEFNKKTVRLPASIHPSNSLTFGFQRYDRYSRSSIGMSLATKKIENSCVYGSDLKDTIFVSKESLAKHPKSEDLAIKIVKNWFEDNEEVKSGRKLYFIEKQIVDYLELQDGVNVFDYDKLPKILKPRPPRPKPVGNTIGKKKSQAWRVSIEHAELTVVNTLVDVDFDDETKENIYIAIENKKVKYDPSFIHTGNSDRWVKYGLNWLVDKNSSEIKNLKLLGLTARQLEEVKDKKNWIEVRDFIKIQFEKLMLLKSEIEESFRSQVRYSKYESVLLRSVPQGIFDELVKKDPNHELLQLKEMYTGSNIKKNYEINNFSNLLNAMQNNCNQILELLGNDQNRFDLAKKELEDTLTLQITLADAEKNKFIALEEDLIKKYPIFNMWIHGYDPSRQEKFIKILVEKCL